MTTVKTYDAVVVGAGHNGLTAAAFLAKAGLDVVCVENNDYIGGAAVSGHDSPNTMRMPTNVIRRTRNDSAG